MRTFGARDVRSLVVAAQSDVDRAVRSAALDAAEHGAGPLWSFSQLDARTAMLRMPTWVTYNSTWDWKGFLESTFADLAMTRMPNLIVDLRGNEGGTTEVEHVLAAHLIDVPLRTDDERRLVRYRAVPVELVPYLTTYDPELKNWGASATYFDARFYQLTGPDAAVDATIDPSTPRFHGTVWVLVDAANSSATFAFDRLVQERHLAVLAGAPTGGNRRGINGGAFFFVHLPYSGIEVDLPVIAEEPVTEQPDAGLVPDIVAPFTQAAIAAGRDPALDAVRRRIAGGG